MSAFDLVLSAFQFVSFSAFALVISACQRFSFSAFRTASGP
jgi:hypothetical protein